MEYANLVISIVLFLGSGILYGKGHGGISALPFIFGVIACILSILISRSKYNDKPITINSNQQLELIKTVIVKTDTIYTYEIVNK